MTSTEYFQYQICRGRPTYDWIGDPENALMNYLINPWIKKNDSPAAPGFLAQE